MPFLILTHGNTQPTINLLSLTPQSLDSPIIWVVTFVVQSEKEVFDHELYKSDGVRGRLASPAKDSGS